MNNQILDLRFLMPNTNMKKAVIFTATKNARVFRSSRVFRNRQIHLLSTHDYQVSEYKVAALPIIPEHLAEVSDNTLGFLWLRFHGSSKSMAACENGDITLDNIKELFKDLEHKMIDDGIIFLESCSTGSLSGDFYNNVQFAFAKLTLKKPGIKIIAPSQDSHISQFSIDDLGIFSFQAIAPAYQSKEDEDITIILGEETKRFLLEANDQKKELASISDSLRSSLSCNSSSVNFNVEGIPKYFMLDAEYDFSRVLRSILMDKGKFSSPQVLAMVKQLIDEHYADVNVPSDHEFYPFDWHTASPLGAAIYRADPELVTYLLSKGADPNHVFRERTLVELAEIHAKLTEDFRCLEILKAHLAADVEQAPVQNEDVLQNVSLAI